MAASSCQSAALAILSALGFTPAPVSVGLLEAWAACEEKTGLLGDCWGWNNPLSGTLPLGGSFPMNSAGVQFYPSQQVGAQANAYQIRGLTSAGTPGIDYYPTLRAALQTGNAALFFSATSEMATWGTDLACIQAGYAPDYTAAAAPTPPSSQPPIIPSLPFAPSPWPYVGLGGAGLAGLLLALWPSIRRIRL